MTQNKTILVVINDAFDKRAFLESGFLDYLKQRFKQVIIIQAQSTEQRDQQFIKQYQKDNVVVDIFIEPKATLYQKFIFKLLRYGVHAPTSLIVLMDSMFKINGYPRLTFRWIFLPVLLVSWQLGRFKPWRSFLRMLYKQVRPDKYYFDLLKKYQPDVVFAKYAALGVIHFNTLFFKSAKIKNIKVIGSVFSWDNLYSKIFLAEKVDYLAVGTNIVKQRALEISDFQENEIAVTGLSQFDFYFRMKREENKSKLLFSRANEKMYGSTDIHFRKEFFKTRAEFFSSIGADQTKPMILFAIGTNNYERYISAEYFLDLLLLMDSLKDYQIYVRNYPKARFDQSFLQKYGNNKRVILEEQPSYQKGSFDFKPNDRQRLFNMIFHSELVITFYSTFILEAFIFNKPVVNINYSGGLKRGYFRSIKRLEKYTHIKQILKHQCLALVKNDKEFIRAIEQYLSNPLLHQNGRQKAFEEQVIFKDGQSAKRLADFVTSNSL